ncbi:oligopeptide transporter, OPT family [bacterium]|nr:oligopeptide transporter, OPT family [bacterium]
MSEKHSEKRGLSDGAYGGVSGEEYKPYIPSSEKPLEFTLRACIIGSVLGILFAAANAAVGLRVGLTISASIPTAVMAVAIFGLMKKLGARKGTILENNIVQSIGSAGESLAAGVIFTIPAFFLTSFILPEEYTITIFQIFITALIGGLLGVFFMIPLRRYLIKKEHGNLPYPEGTACAEVLVAGETGGAQAKQVFFGLGAGAVYTALLKGLRLWKNEAEYYIPGYKNGLINLDVTPALLGVGYILGYRISAIMVGGAIISWLGLIPLISIVGDKLTAPMFPADILISEMDAWDIWDYYIRYIGAGAVAFGGIITLIRAVPTIIESFRLGFREVAKSVKGTIAAKIRTDRDLPLIPILIGAFLLAIVMAFLPQIPVGIIGGILVVIFSFFFTTVSSRIVGIIGSSSNPISGMTIATLLGTSLVFVMLGWTGTAAKVAALSVGAVVAMSIAIAGDTSQDLKTGFLVGATPSKQQIGEMVGVITSALFIGFTVILLHKTYVIGSDELPAPQATIMSFVVKGIIGGDLPWALIFIGVFLGLTMEILGLPSLPLAVGIYLPLSTMATVFAGGIVRTIVEFRSKGDELKKENRERGILFASGLVGGEGIVTVIVALVLLALNKTADEVGFGPEWGGHFQDVISLAVFAILAVVLYRSSFEKR